VTNGSSAGSRTTAEIRYPRMPPEGNDWETRRLKAEMCLIPWIEQFYPLRGRTVFEYGCGNGAVSSAFGARVHRHVGVDIDQAAVEFGRHALAERGLQNVELKHCPVDTILDETEGIETEIDVFLLYAVLEHMTIPERLRLLSVARDVVQPNGIIVVCELPNRLIPFDGHTSQMPFFAQLPDELAIRYYPFAPRDDFVSAMSEAADSGEANSLETLARWGRGMSFHEFELVFGDLREYVIASNYDELLMPVRMVSDEELTLARSLEEYRPDLAPVWSRYWQDVIFSAAPMNSVPRFMRPLRLDVIQGVGIQWVAPGALAVLADAPVQVTLPRTSDQFLVGVKADVDYVDVNLATPTGNASSRLPPWRSRGDTRYATFETSGRSEELEIRLSSGGYLSFLGYSA
jgi:SAM-dependent methyltransferase